MSKKNEPEIADVIDTIYDCLEMRMSDADMKGWLRMPNTSLKGLTPNEMLRAGKARELLSHIEKAFGFACSSTPTLVETLQ